MTRSRAQRLSDDDGLGELSRNGPRARRR